MLTFTKRCAEHGEPADHTLSLPFETRQKSRFRAQLGNGTAVGVVLDRGLILRHGDLLEDDDGVRVRIEASPEAVSQVRASDPLLLARACYHLGNRHVPLQIDTDGLRYLHDHVLDDMVRGLGLTVEFTQAPFEPEAGAYAGGGHGHGHHHDHAH
ncbi:urease accessory protein UreE [Thioalkalivibrio sulfidiphilus]|uniref:urease accessory protein UreE n=1 Tax=Thioalkalivibrio sulfidiphilus TaxID=1033854 RepID=UPI003BAE5CA1